MSKTIELTRMNADYMMPAIIKGIDDTIKRLIEDRRSYTDWYKSEMGKEFDEPVRSEVTLVSLEGNGKSLPYKDQVVIQDPAYNSSWPIQKKVSYILGLTPNNFVYIGEIINAILDREPTLLQDKGIERGAFRRNVSSTISQKIKDGVIFTSRGKGLDVTYGLKEWIDGNE